MYSTRYPQHQFLALPLIAVDHETTVVSDRTRAAAPQAGIIQVAKAAKLLCLLSLRSSQA